MNEEEFLKLGFVSDEIFRINVWKSCYVDIGKKSNNKWTTSIKA